MNIDFNSIWQQLLYNPKVPMLFNSGFFLWWFVFVMLIFMLLQRKQAPKIIYITLISFFFYYKSSGFFFYLLIISTVVDYYLSKWIYIMHTKAKKKTLLVFSLIVNLGLLAYFKYTNFFIEISNDVGHLQIKPMDIFLPVGISFYTFQSLSYTIDVYRNKLKPLDTILDFAFCVSFFPHLVAGPIIRASYIIPQIHKPTYITKRDIGKATTLIVAGLFKKAIISDYISTNFVDRIFDNPLLYSGFENLMGVYGYALQIYCDFSGYSDIAIGIALLIGFKIPLNFDSPYQSHSITEFWRRWHMSLSSWLKDYLYISLGGNRKGKIRTYIHLLLTMLIGGLWHGASWKFVIWGTLHGVGLAIDKFLKSIVKVKGNIFTRFIGVLFTFHFVCLCWIFFRANNFNDAILMLKQIAYQFNGQIALQLFLGYRMVFVLFALGYILHFVPRKYETKMELLIIRSPFWVKALLLLLVIWLVIQTKSAELLPFIYFQF